MSFQTSAWTCLVAIAAVSSVAIAEIRTETIEHELGGITFRSTLVYDDAQDGRRPAVLVFPEWWGVNDHAKQRATALAELGYVALAVDMYGDAFLTDKPAEASRRAGALYADRPALRARATAAMRRLADHDRVDGARITAIGYCFGGTVALELARTGAPLAAAVCFHGGLTTPDPEDNRRIVAEIMVCNGYDDPMVSMEDRAAFMKSMTEAGVRWTFIEYGGAVHSFTSRSADDHGIAGVAYDRRADARAWGHLRTLLESVFAK